MKISAFYGANTSDLPYESKYDIALVGKQIDDRCKAAVKHMDSISNKVMLLSYCPLEHIIELNGIRYDEQKFEDIINIFRDKKVIIESTTLNTGEVFSILKYLKEANLNKIDFNYVDPKSYKNSETRIPLQKSFELSEKISKFHVTLPTIIDLSNTTVVKKGVIFLGYEEDRLKRLIDDNESISLIEKTFVLGNPPFKPGWETNSYFRNINELDGQKKYDSIKFCGAKNPADAFRLLEKVFNTLSENEKMFIAPIGPKPLGIASAIFSVLNTEKVGLLFDYPIEKPHRTTEVNNWHIFRLDLI